MSVSAAIIGGKLCLNVAAIVGAISSGESIDEIGKAFSDLVKNGQEAAKLRSADQEVVLKALLSAEKKVTAYYEEALKNSHSAGFAAIVETTFANLAEVFTECVPRGQALAKLSLDPRRIGEAIADAAVAREMEVFGEGEGRKLLLALVALAFKELDKSPKFMETMARFNWRELFEQLGDLKADISDLRSLVDRRAEELKLNQAEKAQLVTDLERVRTDLHGTTTLLSGFLAAIVGENIPPDQYGPTLFRLAANWKEAGARLDALSSSRNLSPLVGRLRDEAQAAHAAGDLEQATRLLDRIDAEEAATEEKLTTHHHEILAEMQLRREGRLRTKEAQIALALTGLRHADAARFMAELVGLSESDADKRFTALTDRFVTFYERGRDKGLNADLATAIEIARVMLEHACNSKERGESKNNLGNALLAFGLREASAKHLEESLNIYRDALTDRTRARAPLDWAATQSNIGVALWSLGDREGDFSHLEAAVVAYRLALEERTRQIAPLDWAATQNNLGVLLRTIGDYENGTSRLEEAVLACRSALEERRQDRVPLDWAMSQTSLGGALLSLGRREQGVERLQEAVTAFRAALTEYRRDCAPLDWAMTRNNLGIALSMIGDRESGTFYLREAVDAFRDALTERKRDRVPLDWAATQLNLGATLRILGEREDATEYLEEAVNVYRSAAGEYQRNLVPLKWALVQNNMGNALSTLGQRENGSDRLHQAVQAYRAALEERKRDRVSLDWAETQSNLGITLQTIAARENRTDYLKDAVAAFRLALLERTQEKAPHLWAITQNNLAQALKRLGVRGKSKGQIKEAINAFRESLKVLTKESAPYHHRLVQEGLDYCLNVLAEHDCSNSHADTPHSTTTRTGFELPS